MKLNPWLWAVEQEGILRHIVLPKFWLSLTKGTILKLHCKVSTISLYWNNRLTVTETISPLTSFPSQFNSQANLPNLGTATKLLMAYKCVSEDLRILGCILTLWMLCKISGANGKATLEEHSSGYSTAVLSFTLLLSLPERIIFCRSCYFQYKRVIVTKNAFFITSATCL